MGMPVLHAQIMMNEPLEPLSILTKAKVFNNNQKLYFEFLRRTKRAGKYSYLHFSKSVFFVSTTFEPQSHQSNNPTPTMFFLLFVLSLASAARPNIVITLVDDIGRGE
jgi:hypothetical protein